MSTMTTYSFKAQKAQRRALYHVDIKKKDIDSHYRINKMLEQKTFMILKEAETLDYIPLKVTSSMGLKNTPVYSIFRFLEE